MNSNAAYYIVTDGPDAERVYGDQRPVCLDRAEVERLSREWDTDLFAIMHEADAHEIAEYGVYDAPEYIVYWTGGDRDGETLAVFADEDEAIAYAMKFLKEHDGEFAPVCGGVGICKGDGTPVEW